MRTGHKLLFFLLLGIVLPLIGLWYVYLFADIRLLVLLQNNYELRPTGGFLGSYARVHFHNGKIDVAIEDIYTPDGQIQGHVDPPWPIQAAFGQGWFRLRDSNFDPDFPTSAQTILWFMEKGGEENFDGVIAIDLSVFAEIIDVVGPIYVVDQSEKLTKESFYSLMQSEVELGFFPGSQQKKHYLSKVKTATLLALETTSLEQKFQLLLRLFSRIHRGHIQAYSTHQLAQFVSSALGMDGGISRGGNTNYFSFFEANLGTNKANCCIKRQVDLSVKEDRFRHETHEARIEFFNENPQTLKQPPYTWGGAYLVFLRLYIPIESELRSLKVGGIERSLLPMKIEDKNEEPIRIGEYNWEKTIATHSALHRVEITKNEKEKLQSVGFFVVIDAVHSESITLSYTRTRGLWEPKKMRIQKQSGVEMIPYTVIGRNTSTQLPISSQHTIRFN